MCTTTRCRSIGPRMPILPQKKQEVAGRWGPLGNTLHVLPPLLLFRGRAGKLRRPGPVTCNPCIGMGEPAALPTLPPPCQLSRRHRLCRVVLDCATRLPTHTAVLQMQRLRSMCDAATCGCASAAQPRDSASRSACLALPQLATAVSGRHGRGACHALQSKQRRTKAHAEARRSSRPALGALVLVQ